MELTALLHASKYHAGHLAHLAVGIFLHHLLHALDAAVRIAVVQQAQALDEEELRTVLS